MDLIKMLDLQDELQPRIANRFRYGTGSEVAYWLRKCQDGEVSSFNLLHGLDVDTNESLWCFRSGRPEEFYSTNRCKYDSRLSYAIPELMEHSRNALNNSGGSHVRSFSKCLAAPLFKYNGGKDCLIIAKLESNTIRISVQVDYFLWCGERGVSWDAFGREIDRYGSEFFDSVLPFRALCSDKKLDELLLCDITPDVVCGTDMADIDFMDGVVTDFTIDVSNLYKPYLNSYFAHNGYPGLKPVVSYKVDREVLTTELEHDRWRVTNSDVVEIIRFMYLLRLSGRSERFDTTLKILLDSKFLALNDDEKQCVMWVQDYLTGENLCNERDAYGGMFNNSNSWKAKYEYRFYFWVRGVSVRELVERIEQQCFTNKELLYHMMVFAGV